MSVYFHGDKSIFEIKWIALIHYSFYIDSDAKHISKDTQKLLQLRNIAFPRHQKKERWETRNDKTDATYETTNTRTK